MIVTRAIALVLCVAFVFISCHEDDQIGKDQAVHEMTPQTDLSDQIKSILPEGKTLRKARSYSANLNDLLQASGSIVEIEKLEYITDPDSDEVGQTVFFSDRGNKRLSSDWVPFDDRRPLGANDFISYIIDQVDVTGDVSAVAADDAISDAMGTWSGVNCSNLDIPRLPDFGVDWGIVQSLFGFGGTGGWLADITHAGFLPGAFFDAIAPGGSNFILGVTFTFVWTGTNEVAFREIYYNDNFGWNTGSTFDIETVALHEAGHALSQGHFGKAHRTDANGKIHFSPRAVMNASYSGVQTSIGKTDKAGHCSNWGNWPNN